MIRYCAITPKGLYALIHKKVEKMEVAVLLFDGITTTIACIGKASQ